MIYTVFVGICFPANRQGMATLFTDLHKPSLLFDWKSPCSHAGDDDTAASCHHRWGYVAATPGIADDSTAVARVGRPGLVDATPRACAPGLHLEEQAVYVFIAQAGAGDTSTAPSRGLGSVDATPGACALGLRTEGRVIQPFAAKVDSQATAVSCRPGSVDATPGASTPGQRLARSALSLVAQVGNASMTTAQAGRLGSVDATPAASAPDKPLMKPASVPAIQVSETDTATTQTGRLGFIETTPSVDETEAAASTASRRGLVAATPEADPEEDRQLPSGGVVVFTPPLLVPTSDSPILLQRHQLDDAAAHMIDSHHCPVSAVAVLSLSGSHPRKLSRPVPQHMSSLPRSVTTCLQRIKALVCAAGPLPEADEWAPLFWELDQAWSQTHHQRLTTPDFILHLSTYIMVQDQLTPSSAEAGHVRDTASSVARVRLGLLLNKGPTYGLGQQDGAPAQAVEARIGERTVAPEADPLLPVSLRTSSNLDLDAHVATIRLVGPLDTPLPASLVSTALLLVSCRQFQRLVRSGSRRSAPRRLALAVANLTMVKPGVRIAVAPCSQRSAVIYSFPCRLPSDGRHGLTFSAYQGGAAPSRCGAWFFVGQTSLLPRSRCRDKRHRALRAMRQPRICTVSPT